MQRAAGKLWLSGKTLTFERELVLGDKIVALAMVELRAADEPTGVDVEEVLDLVEAKQAKYAALLRDPAALRRFIEAHRPYFPPGGIPDIF